MRDSFPTEIVLVFPQDGKYGIELRLPESFPGLVGWEYIVIRCTAGRRWCSMSRPSAAREVGKIWARDYDIDIAGQLLNGDAIFGEAKWSKRHVGLHVLAELQLRRGSTSYQRVAKRTYYVLTSRAGFSPELMSLAAAEEGRNIRLVDLARLTAPGRQRCKISLATVRISGRPAATGGFVPVRSAGLLMYRRHNHRVEVLLIHPGGPFWVNKDAGAWSVPKGQYNELESPLAAARREFREETGLGASGPFISLGTVKQSGGKEVVVWAFEDDCDAGAIRSNTFTMEWPPKSGKQQEFPEVDRAEWFDLVNARKKILPAQSAFIDALERELVRGDTR